MTPSEPRFDELFGLEADFGGNEGQDLSGSAPAVVVVMVAHDPGWWLEETLASIGDQDYSNLSVLLIDAGSSDSDVVRERLGSVLPDAHLRRLETNPGFGAAANEVLVAVQGAAFYLFCHDDVRLEPDVVRLLVEEAFRSNAGIIGPKLVEWSDPKRLISVGMGSDRYGHASPYVERGDLDQEQHDAVRDVFYIPGAVTLVRADLFAAVGGFDRDMTFHGEDLDLCWRAHVAGARVIVAPSARVGHLEALGVRRSLDDRRRLQARHRLRAMKVSDSFGTRVRVTFAALVLAFLEIIQSVVLGHFRQARDIASAWTWNFRNRSSAKERRSILEQARRVPDSDVRAFQNRRSARLSAFLRDRLGGSDAASGGREFVSNLRESRATSSFVAWLCVVVFLVLGSRELLLDGIPVVGRFAEFLGPWEMLSRWTSGYQSVGLGSTAPAPTGFAILGILGVSFLGAVDLLRTVLLLGMWPIGALGIWRLAKPFASRRGRIVTTVFYVAIPVASNAMATGGWGGLVTYGVLPWVLGQIVAAGGLAPFGPRLGVAGPGVRPRPWLHRVVAIGLLGALAATIEPSVIALIAVISVVLVIGSALTGSFVGSGRTLLVGVAGAALAAVLHLPWSLSFLSDWQTVVGASSAGGFSLELGDVLRFGNGPFGRGIFGWMFVIAAVLPLLIGRNWRLAWAVRCWFVAASGFGVAWAIGQGWLVGWLPSSAVVLVPASLGISLAAGLGMVAFEVDLPDYRFGWRQLVSVMAFVAFVGAMLPTLAATLSGRWDLPRSDYQRSLSFLDGESDTEPFRVLWLGDAAALPLGGWVLEASEIDDLGPDRTLAFATTAEGTPTIAEQWPGSLDGATGQLESALQIAAEGGTARLGSLLAPMAVRYIVVPLAPAPDPYARSRSAVPSDLLAVLDGQLDLASVTVNQGVRVYKNSAWGPGRSLLPVETKLPDGGEGGNILSGRRSGAIAKGVAILPDSTGFASWAGTIEGPGEAYVSSAGGENWKLEVDGVPANRTSAFGWASSFNVGNSGSGSLYFETPLTRWLALLGQLALWIVLVIYMLRVGVREEEGNVLGDPNVVVVPGLVLDSLLDGGSHE
ncbi:Glycosyltransferase like family 2 [Acidimicrobiia bacterium]